MRKICGHAPAGILDIDQEHGPRPLARRVILQIQQHLVAARGEVLAHVPLERADVPRRRERIRGVAHTERAVAVELGRQPLQKVSEVPARGV